MPKPCRHSRTDQTGTWTADPCGIPDQSNPWNKGTLWAEGSQGLGMSRNPWSCPQPLLLPGCPCTATEAVMAPQHSHCYKVMPYNTYFVCISALQLLFISKGILKTFETLTQHKFIRQTARPRSDISKLFTSESKRFCSQASSEREQTTAAIPGSCLRKEGWKQSRGKGTVLALSDILWSWRNQKGNSHERSLQRHTGRVILIKKKKS